MKFAKDDVVSNARAFGVVVGICKGPFSEMPDMPRYDVNVVVNKSGHYEPGDRVIWREDRL